jgi:hypothetical protein
VIMSAADITISSLSTEYVQVPVQATIMGVPYNPTADAVSLAFVVGNAYPTLWYAGSWVTTAQGNYLAQTLIGPANGGTVLAPGTYNIYVKITDNPEVPVIPSGSVTVT